jgi:hypothetical protein
MKNNKDAFDLWWEWAPRLVELRFKVKTLARPASKSGRTLRAQELGTKAIEKIIDPVAPPEERAQRRRPAHQGTVRIPRGPRRSAEGERIA